jgi:hypothetical protein
MNNKRLMKILPISIGIASAMGVALKNNSLGLAIGIAIFVGFNFLAKRKAQ